MSKEAEEKVQETEEAITLVEFLETVPPSTVMHISDLVVKRGNQYKAWYDMRTPEIQLHCPNETCNGPRFFRCTSSDGPKVQEGGEGYNFDFVSYLCSNCRSYKKTFSVALKKDKGSTSGLAYKFGELPVYGPQTSSKLISLIGPDRETFLKGRRCESQGLGIGAFVYYRRVVENQKNRILDRIIKVSEKVGASTEVLDSLCLAKSETQFSKALRSVRDAMPESLLINGHNPLTLLHSALSNGLHDQTDEECLEIARSVRVVLGDLSERLAQALRDEEELNRALAKLMERKNGAK